MLQITGKKEQKSTWKQVIKTGYISQRAHVLKD